jgi:hypothetical protein
MKIGLCVVAYRRSEKLRQVLRQVAYYKKPEESVMIFCDGARGTGDADDVAQTQEVARQFDKINEARVVASPVNLGLARNVTGAVTSGLSELDACIVLEDDLVMAPGYLDFMRWALQNARDEQEIMHVSGYSLPGVQEASGRTYTLPIISSWGWGTWRDRWKQNLSLADAKPHWEKIEAEGRVNEFDFHCRSKFSTMIRDRFIGKNNSWAILWYLSVFLNRGRSLYPGCSLVQNQGFDGSGENCGSFDMFPGFVSLDPFRGQGVFTDVAAMKPFEDRARRAFEREFGLRKRISRKLQRTFA